MFCKFVAKPEAPRRHKKRGIMRGFACPIKLEDNLTINECNDSCIYDILFSIIWHLLGEIII